jgi:hypothetical protein
MSQFLLRVSQLLLRTSQCSVCLEVLGGVKFTKKPNLTNKDEDVVALVRDLAKI